jgi:hypothetical protein
MITAAAPASRASGLPSPECDPAATPQLSHDGETCSYATKVTIYNCRISAASNTPPVADIFLWPLRKYSIALLSESHIAPSTPPIVKTQRAGLKSACFTFNKQLPIEIDRRAFGKLKPLIFDAAISDLSE